MYTVLLSQDVSRLRRDQEYPRSEQENPLTIAWCYDPNEGLLLDSIKGSLGGMEACFYLEQIDECSHLIGSASLDFHKLSKWVPPSLAEVFTELDMGKGYELRVSAANRSKRPIAPIFSRDF